MLLFKEAGGRPWYLLHGRTTALLTGRQFKEAEEEEGGGRREKEEEQEEQEEEQEEEDGEDDEEEEKEDEEQQQQKTDATFWLSLAKCPGNTTTRRAQLELHAPS